MAKELSCGVSLIRGILVILNILFIILGLTLIGFGVYVKVNNNFSSILDEFTTEKDFESQSLGFLAFAMIGGGVFTLLIALFGCAGSIWNNRCFLGLYAIILGMLMILELVALVMAFAYKSKLTDVYETSLAKVFHKGWETHDDKVINGFHELEKNLKCCGVYNITDYAEYHLNTTDYSEGCRDHPNDGCSRKIIDFLSGNLPIVGYSLLSVFLLEFFAVLGAIAFMVALKHAPDDGYSSSPGEGYHYKATQPDRRRNYT